MAATQAAQVPLAPIDPDDPGRHDYAGPLLSDLLFPEWSASALRRMAEEVCIQGHLLVLAFLRAARTRTDSDGATVEFGRRQFTGAAGVAAARLRNALDLGPTLDDAARLLSLHPALLPRAYVGCDIEPGEKLVVHLDRHSPAVVDGAWPSMIDADHLGPLDAIVQAVDRRFRCHAVSDDGSGLDVEVVRTDTESPVPEDEVLARFSTGADFTFEDRGTPVVLRRA
jgi:hypothetical protein